jgi:hypothetical protein
MQRKRYEEKIFVLVLGAMLLALGLLTRVGNRSASLKGGSYEEDDFGN